MSYTPATWNTGDIVTADKMNNIELGVQYAVNNVDYREPLTVTVTKEATTVSGDPVYQYSTNKTSGAIYNAFTHGAPVVFFLETEPSANYVQDDYAFMKRAVRLRRTSLTPSIGYTFYVDLDGQTDLEFSGGGGYPSATVPREA